MLVVAMPFRMQTWQGVESSTTEHSREKNASHTNFIKFFSCAGSLCITIYVSNNFKDYVWMCNMTLWSADLPSLDLTFYGCEWNELNRVLQPNVKTFGVEIAPVEILKLIKHICSPLKPHDVFLCSCKCVAEIPE